MNIFHGVCLSHAKTYDEKKKKENGCTLQNTQ